MRDSQENDLSPWKDRLSTITTDSGCSSEDSHHLSNLEIHPSILALFQDSSQTSSLSEKMIRKAINWLLSIAWSKDYCLQTGWTAIMLFYGFKSQKPVKKQNVEQLLLICLQLASKIHEPTPMKTSQLLLCSSTPISREILSDLEVEILELFNYSLYIPNMFEMIASFSGLDEESTMKVLFLGELYLTKGAKILFDFAKCKKLVQIVKKTTFSEDYELEMMEIQELAFDQKNSVIYSKFASKFDMEIFLSHFQ